MAAPSDVVSKTFRALAESADRKFARIRDLPACGRTPDHYFQKVFQAYMRLWKYQQDNRSKLVEAGLNRWEIGEIASCIGQLYFNQYMRSSELRFLVEAFVFYEAILHRSYFEGVKAKDLGVRFKELRFYARFLLVSLILNRADMVQLLVDRFKALIDDCKSNFREPNFKEWKLVVQEIIHFMEVDSAFANLRPLRYSILFDSYPTSRPYVARFYARKVLKFRDAVLTSYHHNEVKFAELTLDAYRMLQCLEWDPSGSFYPKKRPVKSYENDSATDHSVASALMDINLAADLTDPNLPPNPRKAILYRPSATHLLAVMATLCEELPPESLMLIYLSASGKAGQGNVSPSDSSGESKRFLKNKVAEGKSSEKNDSATKTHSNGKLESVDYHNTYLWLGPRGTSGSNTICPGDIIPFTRRPLFIIIDSDCSYAFKILHGAERGEPAALLLSPVKPSFWNLQAFDLTRNGCQFTLFLAAPLQAFCHLVGITSLEGDTDIYNNAEDILSNSFSEWEVILCTSKNLDIVWAQVLSDPFLRRLILRFIFCRVVLSVFCSTTEDRDQYLPVCLPDLPSSVSPSSEVVYSAVVRLANHLKVAHYFHFNDL